MKIIKRLIAAMFPVATLPPPDRSCTRGIESADAMARYAARIQRQA